MVAKSQKRISLATGADYWYVRLPDGRILRSRSTDALRAHLKAGRIPWNSRVRRSREEPWRPVGRTAAFADLAKVFAAQSQRRKKRQVAPPKPKLGVRRSVDELCNALDFSFRKNKLVTTALTGLVLGVTFLLSTLVAATLPAGWNWLAYLGAAAVACILFSTCSAIVSQLTAFEVSRYRAAQFHEINSGLLGSILRVAVTYALLGGVIGGLIFVLRSLSGWITPADLSDMDSWFEVLVSVVAGCCLFLEVLCWPLLAFTLLLAPILVVEDCSIWRGFTAWLAILRQHFGRVAIYQTLVFASAAVLTLPLLAPLWLTFGGRSGSEIPLYLLLGVAMAPTLTYLFVAQVFVYLNLRYEFHYSAREKS